MTGAYDELVSAGRFGPQCARMLYRAVQTVAIARSFPPPDGHVRWDRDAAMDVAHDFLAAERGRKRITDLAIRATDDASLERLLHAAVLNFHRDRSRRTDAGALIRRGGDVLSMPVRREHRRVRARSRRARRPSAGGPPPLVVSVAVAAGAVGDAGACHHRARLERRERPDPGIGQELLDRRLARPLAELPGMRFTQDRPCHRGRALAPGHGTPGGPGRQRRQLRSRGDLIPGQPQPGQPREAAMTHATEPGLDGGGAPAGPAHGPPAADARPAATAP